MNEDNKKKKAALLILLLLLFLGAAIGIYFGISKDENAGNDISVDNVDKDTTEEDEDVSAEQDDGIYEVQILKSAHGSVTANKTEAVEGDEIVLTVKPDEGYELKSLTVNKTKSETTFKMPAKDVKVLAKFSLIVGKGNFFGKSGDYESSDVINFKTDKGLFPYLELDATKGTPLYAYINDLSAKQFFFETEVEVTGILKSEKYPKFGIMTNDGTEMVKFYLDMNTKKAVSSVGAVHQATGESDDWANQDYFSLDEKLDLSKKTVKLGLLRDGKTYYFYVNGELAATGSDLTDKASAAGVFSFGTSLKLTNYKLVTSGTKFDKLLNEAKEDVVEFNKIGLTTNYFAESKDGVYTLKTNSDDESKVDDVKYAGQVLKTSYYSIKGKLTLKNSKDWSQARILISSDPKNEYVIALEQTAKNKYQIFTMSKNNEKIWNNWTSIVGAEINGDRNSIDFEVIADGQKIYFLIDDMICYTSDSVSMTESTVKFASYKNATTVVENLDGQIFAKSEDVQKYLATKDAESFWVCGLTTNYFKEAKDGVYTLTTKSKDESKVDDVIYGGNILKESYYSVRGKLSLTDSEDWSQARILISSDAKNEYVIALEQTVENKYQIFTMSKDNEEIWNDWRLISHADVNGDRNSIDFEVVADGSKIYFLIDNEICYTSDRVSMTESTVKFASYNNATTTVENLDGQLFKSSETVQFYLATKKDKAYESPFQTRINELYKEYFVDNDCAGNRGTLLLGHSHMDRGFWNEWEAQTGLTNYVNGYNVGIGGTSTMDWLYAYDKLVAPFNADRFVISLGENDINVWGADGAEVVERLAELFNKIHTDFPEAEIYYIYSLPAQTKYVNGKWLNSKYAALVKGEKDLVESLEYVEGISMFDLLVDADSQNVKTELYRTNDIHLNAAGYKVWSERLYDLIFYDLSVKGENFGVTKAGDTYYITTGGINLENDKGANPTIDVLGGGTSYAYLNDTFTNKLYFETEITVSEVLNNDGFPKFGLMLNGKTEMVKFYVDMTPEMTADSVGVVHQKTSQNDDWGNAVSAKVPGMKFTGDDTIKLAVARDGRDYYFYVNDKLVLWKNGALFNGDEMSAVGIFSFNSVLTASDYQIYKDADAENYITKAQEDAARFFGDANGLQTSEGVDLSKDTGASTGTVSVDEDGDRYIYAKDFYDAEYYFETKIHVNDVLDTEDYPKFGLFAQDGTERVHFYVNMMKDKTSDKVGRVHNYEWGSEVEVTVNGMSFADEGEYVTLGLLKDGKTLHFYVNGGYVQSYESNFTGNSTVGAFSFKTSMDLKEYYIDQTEETMTAKRELATTNMLSLLSEGSLQTANEGVKIWTDRDYVFTSLPVALAGREFVQGPIAQGVSVNVKKNGYLYVITPVAGAVNSCAKILDGYNFSRLDVAMWRFCDASNNNVCVYEKRVESGDKYTLDRWAIVFTSDKPLNFTTNNYITEDDSQLAVLRSVDGYEVHNMTLGAKVFSDRTYTFSDMPYWLAGKNYILNNYTDTEQSAVATREGYVYMYTNTTVANALEGLKQQGFEVVSSDAVHLFSAGTFNQRGFSLLKKHVRADEVVTWSQWAIPIFSGDSQSSNNVIDNIAKLEPIGTSEAAKLTAGARLYNDRLYYLTESLPEELDGMSYIYDSIAGGYAKVTEAGKVYMMLPVMATIYEELVASVEADGWQLTPYRNFRLSPGLEYSCLLYEKEFEVGAEIHYGKYNLLIYGTISEEDYYVLPSVSEPAQIIKNPQGELSSKEQSWLGCPTIERSSEGRLWASWFTGGARELGTGNYATISYSDNDGVTWHHASYVVRHPNTAVQVTKPEFWTDPDGNLWLFWVQHTGTGNFDGKMGVWASVCKNPDAENPTWSEPRRLSDGYLRSKPIILQSGEWIYSAFDWMSPHETAIYVSADKGQTWTLRGKAECLDASSGKNNLDDPVLVEKKNGTLWLVIRTDDGPYESFSKDGGATWTHAVKSSIEGPPTRMTIDRLASGNLLMVYHDASSRTNLTAYLSTDDGETWSHKLLLDERVGVTYPDVIQKSDGTIYVIYDRYRTLDKEILMATFTEQDIINGFFGEDAQQKVLVNDDGK